MFALFARFILVISYPLMEFLQQVSVRAMFLVQSFMNFIKVSVFYLVLGENLSAHWNCRMRVTRVMMKYSSCGVKRQSDRNFYVDVLLIILRFNASVCT